MLQSARDKYAKQVAYGSIELGLKKKVLSAADYVFAMGYLINIWRETLRIWIGPFSVLGVDDKNVIVKSTLSSRSRSLLLT